MKVVLDTNVIVAGLRSRQGASFHILHWLGQRRFTPLLSVPLFLEYEAVLKRPDLVPGLNQESIDIFLNVVASVSDHVKLYYLWRPALADPADDMILELAIAGNADAIVTFNRRDFMEATRRFGVNVMFPNEFLATLQEKQP
ncbi:MAG: putative toxin-antitoxin system toxin component, PIN family [Magnetococcales bacterium]|nr:putative toxin-antitoxin system toxin component, PIN family [Magnetococcales bacterium]